MSRISKILPSSSSSSGAARGGYRSTAIAGNVTHLSIIRFYLKIFVNLLVVIFVLLQYINWENSASIVHSNTSIKSPIILQSQQKIQPERQHFGVTTTIHIVFSTGCNAFQDCKSIYVVVL